MDGVRRLGTAAQKRRDALGLTRDQVYQRGGPSQPTLLKIERGAQPPPQPATLRKLDAGLDWEPGSAARVLAGGDSAEVGAHRARHLSLSPGPNEVAVPVTTITALVSVARELTAHADQHPDAKAISERFNSVIQPVYGNYVTRLLEENKRNGGAFAPLLVVLGPFLDEEIATGDATAIDEGRYRRWLAGMFEPDDDETLAHYRSRLESADD